MSSRAHRAVLLLQLLLTAIAVIHFGTSVESVIPSKYQSVDLAVVRPMALPLSQGRRMPLAQDSLLHANENALYTVLPCLDGILQSSTVDASV